ncbi:hypothetical protein [Cellulomonas sp. NS3]|uniref:hypothetical protein n=1 Tax=Cellulomonas sp. NS3 TaxID=2973977 RepID=UPI002162A73D|nr:hypothetical protein [Cellulomonas sp. NS3]
MNRVPSYAPSSVRRAAAALASTLVLLGLGLAPAQASSGLTADIRGTCVCDSTVGEWVVTWEVTNHRDVAGTIGNVRAYPAGRAIVGLPNRIEPGQTVQGTQRLRSWEYTGSIAFDVNWDDDTVTYDHTWPIYIKITCHKA